MTYGTFYGGKIDGLSVWKMNYIDFMILSLLIYNATSIGPIGTLFYFMLKKMYGKYGFLNIISPECK